MSKHHQHGNSVHGSTVQSSQSVERLSQPIQTPSTAGGLDYVAIGKERAEQWITLLHHQYNSQASTDFRIAVLGDIKDATEEEIKSLLKGIELCWKAIPKEDKFFKDGKRQQPTRLAKDFSYLRRMYKAALIDHSKTVEVLTNNGINKAMAMLPSVQKTSTKRKASGDKEATVSTVLREAGEGDVLMALDEVLSTLKSFGSESYAGYIGEFLQHAFDNAVKQWDMKEGFNSGDVINEAVDEKVA